MPNTMRWSTNAFSVLPGKTVLYVDPDESCAVMLHDVWKRLHLVDDLHVVRSREEALAFLDSAEIGNVHLAAIVLDPEAVGEATGTFVRALRKRCGKSRVPIMFWSHDSEKYEVLEGRGIESVHKKPMVLHLIQSLDAACQPAPKTFSRHPGDRLFAHTISVRSCANFAVKVADADSGKWHAGAEVKS